MKVSEVREKYLNFFKERGHAIIPSSSLVPENDPTTLFTSSGMQPLLTYFLGETHPNGKRIVNLQKCFRTEDIDEVGDNRHTTFFEMMGNWSFGDYFKTDQLKWLFDFLTKEIGLDPNKLFVTVFIGDEKFGIPKDTESAKIWREIFSGANIEAKEVEIGSKESGARIGMQKARIFYYDAKKNWWSRSGPPEAMPEGEPGGPDSEIFYEFSRIVHDKKFGERCHPNCDCGKYIEIGNSVFMEYKKKADGSFERLAEKNVDFGGGLERISAASGDLEDIFTISSLFQIISKLELLSKKKYSDEIARKSMRIITDHVRAAIFMISEGVEPSNSERNYFVRRLIRRSIRHADKLSLSEYTLGALTKDFGALYSNSHPEIEKKSAYAKTTIDNEERKFRQTLKSGLKEFEKIASGKISGKSAFLLNSTFGFPIDLITDLAKEKGVEVDILEFDKEVVSHKEISRKGSEKRFKGGLADTSEISVRYHTATHLLNQALHDVLGDHITQQGSNITSERLRFDFAHPKKMTDEEKSKVETIVNNKIDEALAVNKIILKKEDALKTGARGMFNEKYEDQVSVYFIGKNLDEAYSKELCGGPHVANTNEIGRFKITKEESIAEGVRRIRAVLS